jgi:hypothetical protein
MRHQVAIQSWIRREIPESHCDGSQELRIAPKLNLLSGRSEPCVRHGSGQCPDLPDKRLSFGANLQVTLLLKDRPCHSRHDDLLKGLGGGILESFPPGFAGK